MVSRQDSLGIREASHWSGVGERTSKSSPSLFTEGESEPALFARKPCDSPGSTAAESVPRVEKHSSLIGESLSPYLRRLLWCMVLNVFLSVIFASLTS